MLSLLQDPQEFMTLLLSNLEPKLKSSSSEVSPTGEIVFMNARQPPHSALLNAFSHVDQSTIGSIACNEGHVEELMVR